MYDSVSHHAPGGICDHCGSGGDGIGDDCCCGHGGIDTPDGTPVSVVALACSLTVFSFATVDAEVSAFFKDVLYIQ